MKSNQKNSGLGDKNLIEKTDRTEDNNKKELFNYSELLFDISSASVSTILEFLNLEDIYKISKVNKAWYKKVNEHWTVKEKRMKFYVTVAIIYFIYGHGNAQRLSSLADKAFRNCFSKLDVVKNIEVLDCVLDQKKASGVLSIYLWNMILLGILDIKESDLKFQFGHLSKELIFSYCENLIYDYIVSDKFKSKILNFIASTENRLMLKLIEEMLYEFHKFLRLGVSNGDTNLKYRDDIKYSDNNRDKKVLLCFWKVVFYRMKAYPNDKLLKEVAYLCKGPYIKTGCGLNTAYSSIEKMYKLSKTSIASEPMALYLHVTKDLEYFFTNFGSDFISYFASSRKNISDHKERDLIVDSKPFIAYLNETKPIVQIYKESAESKGGTKSFWQKFFPNENKIEGIDIKKFHHFGDLLCDVTTYLGQDEKMKSDVLASITNISSQLGGKFIDPRKKDKFIEWLFDTKRQPRISKKDEKEINLYFDDFISYFKELEDKNIIKNERFIKLISRLIKDLDTKNPDRDTFGSVVCSDKKNKHENLIKNNNGTLSMSECIDYIKDNKSEKKDFGFSSKEKEQNLNKINLEQNQSDNKKLISQKIISTGLNSTSLFDRTISSDEKTSEQSQKPKVAMSDFLIK